MRLLVQILSLLPLQGLYLLGDCLLYPLMYYVVRYRRKIVAKNLRNAFPDKTDKERKVIEKGFYHHFSDLFAEIIWSYRASEKQLREHYILENVPEIEEVIHEKGGIFFVLGHFGNWEWTPEIQHRYSDRRIQQYNVYRRLKNKGADEVMVSLREKRSGRGTGIEKNDLVRRLIALKQAGTMYSLGLISDQKVSPQNTYYRTTFLNQDTGFPGGGEVLAKKFDKAVGYVHSTQERRGVYRVHVYFITKDPAKTEYGYITERFARMLEQNILEQPELWLWSHNRWKWKREDIQKQA